MSGNPNYDELHYITAIAPLLVKNGFPAFFIVDQSRSGVQNVRSSAGDWCNVLGAGFGMRPTTSTGNCLVDAIVWIKARSFAHSSHQSDLTHGSSTEWRRVRRVIRPERTAI